ncbi:MAG: hypothetical protein WAM14_22805, partial [Candidatus Nitrosopolaris sp.]
MGRRNERIGGSFPTTYQKASSGLFAPNPNAQKDWLTIIHLPKKAPYLNPNERRVNQQIKLDVCANRFYDHIEKLKDAVSEYLGTRFGRWH